MRKKDRIFEENYQLNNGNGNKFTGSFARSITCLFQRIYILSSNFHSECSQISHTKNISINKHFSLTLNLMKNGQNAMVNGTDEAMNI